MTVLTVGTNQQFATLAAAVAASRDGDTIYVQAGDYVNDFAQITTKISIIGVGGMAHFSATIQPPNGKGILVTDTDVNIDHLEISGASVPDGNGAGIRYQGGKLTVTNSYIYGNEMGILANSVTGGSVSIDRSEFGANLPVPGLNPHDIYITGGDSFSITNSYIHDASTGHEIKSRAANTYIADNRIFDNNGTASYTIDVPNGGNATIKNNIIEQGPNSENPTIIAYGEEGVSYANSTLVVQGNTIDNLRPSVSQLGIWNPSSVTAQVSGNHIYGLTAAQIVSGLNTQSNNDILSSAPQLDTSHPWAASPWDKLISGGAGDDTIAGTAGVHDLLVGGGGNDTFNISPGSGSDTIADFLAGSGAGDAVKLSGYSLSSFAAVQAAMTQGGADTVLSLGGGETLTFLNVQKTAFAADDFGFGTVTQPPDDQPPPPPPPPNNPPPTNGPAPVQPFALAVSGTPTHFYNGTSRSNSISGSSGNDSIDGRGGNDSMRGGTGDDTYYVDNSRDNVIERSNQGIDTVISSASSYTLPSYVENLTLSGNNTHIGNGNSLNNLIVASNANDTINGAGGNDIIRAGAGAGTFTGSTGNDMFVFAQVGGLNKVTDLHLGQDLADLRPLFLNYGGSDPVADHLLALRSDGNGGTIVSVDPTHSGIMQDIADLQYVALDTVRIGVDLLWH